jgi:hypothetical protein
MKKLIAASLATFAMLGASGALGSESDRVVGESLDSGLGSLPATYTGAEFMKWHTGHIAGEKLDSGLGNVTDEELRRIVAKYTRT